MQSVSYSPFPQYTGGLSDGQEAFSYLFPTFPQKNGCLLMFCGIHMDRILHKQSYFFVFFQRFTLFFDTLRVMISASWHDRYHIHQKMPDKKRTFFIERPLFLPYRISLFYLFLIRKNICQLCELSKRQGFPSHAWRYAKLSDCCLNLLF